MMFSFPEKIRTAQPKPKDIVLNQTKLVLLVTKTRKQTFVFNICSPGIESGISRFTVRFSKLLTKILAN